MTYTHSALLTPPQFTDKQDWDAYTADDHGVWKFLFERQLKLVADRACPEYLDGIQKLGLRASQIPDYKELNTRMKKATGWQIAVVPNYLTIRL
jgi:phenylalanine-4-hydroxylase